MPSLPVSHKVETQAKRHEWQAKDRQATRALNTGSKAWFRIRTQVLTRDHWTCQICGILCMGKGQAHVDHIDGDASHNDLDRLRCLCVSCHSKVTAAKHGGFGNAKK